MCPNTPEEAMRLATEQMCFIISCIFPMNHSSTGCSVIAITSPEIWTHVCASVTVDRLLNCFWGAVANGIARVGHFVNVWGLKAAVENCHKSIPSICSKNKVWTPMEGLVLKSCSHSILTCLHSFVQFVEPIHVIILYWYPKLPSFSSPIQWRNQSCCHLGATHSFCYPHR